MAEDMKFFDTQPAIVEWLREKIETDGGEQLSEIWVNDALNPPGNEVIELRFKDGTSAAVMVMRRK